MKNTRKKITSLLLSLAILGSSFIASYAVSTNESPVYKDENVNVVVEEKYDKESNTLELDLKLETLNDETEIENIVFPKTEEEKTADLLKEPEEVTEKHEYKYEVTENGDYEFTVNYNLTVPTQSSNDNRSVNEQTENSSTVETEEGAEDPEPEPVAEGETEAQAEVTAEPETLSTSVIPQTFKFTVKVDKIKDLTEPETQEVTEPETPSEEVDPNEETPSEEVDSNEDPSDEVLPGEEPDEIGTDTPKPDVFTPRAGDWSQTNGGVTVNIKDFDPTTSWGATGSKTVSVTYTFGEANKDAKNKKVVFSLKPGLMYATYPMKGEIKYPGVQTNIIGINDNLVKSTYSETYQSRYQTHNGDITYYLEDQGVASITIDFEVEMDTQHYSYPVDLADAITATGYIGSEVQGEVSTSVNLNEGDIRPVLFAGAGGANNIVDVVEGSSQSVTSTAMYTYRYPQTLNNGNWYIVSATYYIPVPKEIKAKNVVNLPTGATFDEENHIITYTRNHHRSTFGPRVSLSFNGLGLEAGSYTADRPWYVEYTDVFGNTNTFDKYPSGGKPAPYRINVIKEDSIENKLIHSSANLSYLEGQSTNIEYRLGAFTISNDNISIKKNQNLEMTLSEDLQITEVGVPEIRAGGIKEIEYTTNKKTTPQIATESMISIKKADRGATRTSGVLNVNDLGLDDGEYFTSIKVFLGDIPMGYMSAPAGGTSYITGNQIFITGRLAEGKSTAPVKYRTYSTRDDGSIIDDTVVESNRTISSSAAQNQITMQVLTQPLQVNAGNSVKALTKVNSSDLVRDASSNLAAENPKLYLKRVPGIDYSNIKSSVEVRDAVTGDLIQTETPNITIKNISGVDGNEYVEVTAATIVGDYVNGYRRVWNIEYDINTNKSTVGVFEFQDLIMVDFPGMNPVPDTQWNVVHTDVINSGDKLQASRPGRSLTVISSKALFVESSITKNNETAKQHYDGTKETAIGFTINDKLNYFVDIRNLTGADVTSFTSYTPVPREGINFGEHFQAEPFPWNTKIDGVTLEVYDDKGAIVTGTRASNYRIEYASIQAGQESGYQTATYGTAYNEDTSMIRVRTLGPIPDGEHVQVKVRYSIDETTKTIEDNPEKLDALLEFNPYFNYVGGGSDGWSKGSPTGSYLSIGQVQGKVFLDKNYNGVWNGGEDFLPNVKVVLRDTNGDEITHTTTLADGSYAFMDLASGRYTVDFTDAQNQYPYFTFANRHNGTQIGSVVPSGGDNTGLAINVDPANESSKALNVGLLEYRPEEVTIAGNDIQVREPNSQTGSTTDTIVPSFNNINYKNILQTTGYPRYAVEDNTIATVNGQGVVTGVKAGTTKVTISSLDIFGNTITGEIPVTVTANHEPTITFDAGKESLFLNVNDTYNAADGVTIKQGSTVIPVNDSRVTVTPATVNMTQAGVTKVTYKYEDAIVIKLKLHV